MANMRAIRTRIKSIESTRQITSSMKMVAASKLRKTQIAGNALAEYAAKCGEILSGLLCGLEGTDDPFLNARAEIKKTCYVLFVGNRGLCGMYNNAVLRFLQEELAAHSGESFVVAVGRWGHEAMTGAGIYPVRRFDSISDAPDHSEAQELTEYLKQLYSSGEADRIVMVYQHFSSVLSQTPQAKQLLPIEAKPGKRPVTGCIFEPDAKSLLGRLTEMYIDNSVFSTLLEAKTGEHASRMTAMTAASDNTDELIGKLSLELNHARQAAITTEISEIAGGAAALNGR